MCFPYFHSAAVDCHELQRHTAVNPWTRQLSVHICKSRTVERVICLESVKQWFKQYKETFLLMVSNCQKSSISQQHQIGSTTVTILGLCNVHMLNVWKMHIREGLTVASLENITVNYSLYKNRLHIPFMRRHLSFCPQTEWSQSRQNWTT